MLDTCDMIWIVLYMCALGLIYYLSTSMREAGEGNGWAVVEWTMM